MLRTSLIVTLAAGLSLQPSSSQQAGGSARGSIPASSRRLSRPVPFEVPGITSVPLSAEPRKKVRQRPEGGGLVGQLPPATAAGITIIDRTTAQMASPPPVLESFLGIPQSPSIPPDPVIAAGPRHLVAAVNREIWIFDRSGAQLTSESAASWFNAVAPGCSPYDPRVVYDNFSKRFLMLWLQTRPVPQEAYYLLSVSETDDPTGEWTSWALPANVHGTTPSGMWPDNGTLGFDSLAIYIVADEYSFADGTSEDVEVRIILKSELLSAGSDSLHWTDLWDLSRLQNRVPFRVRPAISHDASGPYYLLEVPDELYIRTALVLYRIDSVLSHPTISASFVPVAEWARAKDAGQKVTDVLLDTRGSSLAGEVHLKNGSLYGVFPVANPSISTYSSIRYVRINTATRTAEEDVTFGQEGSWYFYPAIAVDGDGNVCIVFNRSGLTEYPGVFFTWRMAGDPPGLQPSVQVAQGWACYRRTDAGGFNRWGDYNTVVADPLDQKSFWMIGEYGDGPGAWGTWVAQTRLQRLHEGRLAVDRREIDFGPVDREQAGERQALTLRNVGSQPVSIAGAACAKGAFDISGPTFWPTELGPGDSLKVLVTFHPSADGPVNDTLIIRSDDPVVPNRRIELKGTGVIISRARPNFIYATHSDRTGESLYRLTERGEVTRIGSLNIPGIVSLVIVDGSQGEIYGGTPANHGAQILRIDAAAGWCYRGEDFAIEEPTALGFRHPDTLFIGTASGEIFRVNRQAGESVRIARRAGVAFSGLVFLHGSDTLWASAGLPASNDTIYCVDTRSGLVTPVGTTGFSVFTNAMCRGTDGGLYALVENALLRIDTASGRGSFVTYFPVEGLRAIAMTPPSVNVEEENGRPLSTTLAQNYPNPFNSTTTIRYQLSASADVTLEVFDLLGRRVAVLVAERQEAGGHSVGYNGAELSTGVYYYRLRAGDYTAVKKFILLR
jgi:hypothetical protein